MAISVEYGPRVATYGNAAFGSAKDITAFDKLRGLMEMWAQIEESKKQREFQAGQSELERSLRREEMDASKDLAQWQTRANFITQHPNYGASYGYYQTRDAANRAMQDRKKVPF